MKKLRLVSLLLAVVMIFALAACGTGGSGSQTASPASKSEAPAPETDAPEAEPTAEPEPEKTGVYPLVGDDLHLKIWSDFFSPAGAYIEKYEDFPALQIAEERTGVKVDWVSLSPPAASEQFPISIASGDMPDMYRCFLKFYGGSGAQAAEEGIIVELTDLVAQYAPNYNAVLDSKPENRLDAVDDDSRIWTMWTYSQEFVAKQGLTLRGDWLKEQNLEIPKTMEDIENYLNIAKTEYGATAPYLQCAEYAGGADPIAHAFDVGGYNAYSTDDEFFQVDGKAKCSYTEEGYLEYLTLMNKWYNEGLISKDFASISFDKKDGENVGRISTGDTGLFMCEVQSFSVYADAATDDNYELLGIGGINVNDGKADHLINTACRDNRKCFAVTTQCEDPSLAVQWVDYWFSEDGALLSNYGEEGVVWEYVDGKPQFTQLVTDNKEFTDLSVTQIANYYTVYQMTIGYFDETRLFQFYEGTEKESIANWNAGQDNKYVMPLGLSMTAEESDAVNSRITDIRTYVTENAGKFITGDRPLSDWDAFQEEIHRLGIDECIAAYQTAVDRYYAR